MDNKATVARFFYPRKGDMYCPKFGFFMIEILISLILITGFVIMCMRYQARALALQAQAIVTMDVVDKIEVMLDAIQAHDSSADIADCKFCCSSSIDPITMPSIKGNPSNLRLSCAYHMKVVTVTVSWIGSYGQQTCQLPVVLKGDEYGGL